MNDYRDLMTMLDSTDNLTLYKLDNDMFDTVVAIYNEDEPNEIAYVLTDMQGQYPTSIDEISEYDWICADDVNW